jgi:PAP2 superfamily.
LTPLLFTMLLTGILHGFWGEQPRVWYEALRTAYPGITVVMRIITNYSASALYAVYCAILIYAVVVRDRGRIIFVLRFIIMALIYALVVTQLLKAGLGMPRPGHILPPHPFSFSHNYSSFPSGHTVSIITAALPLALWISGKNACISLSMLITSVGISRLWLGAHHPVDIFGGILVGSLAARFIFYRPCPMFIKKGS